MPSSRVPPFFKRHTLFILSAAALMMELGEAKAWGFGRAQSTAVLGMPLDFSVPLRLDASESPPECLAADVSTGDTPVPRSAVFVSLESGSGGPAVRVRTTAAIDEPLVTIRLSAGCGGSSTARRFTLFADPPGHLAAPVLAQADALQVTAPAAAPAALNSPASPATPGQPDQVRTPGAAPAGIPLGAAVPAAAATSLGRGGTDTRGRLPDGATPLADASTQTAQRGAVRASRSKLQLDAPTLTTSASGVAKDGAVSTALQSAQAAASAARAAASAAQARAAEMEKSIEALHQEARANREAVARLTLALEKAQGVSTGGFWAALAALGALIALLLVRVRRLQAGVSARPWWSASTAAPESTVQPAEKTTTANVNGILASSGSGASLETATLPTPQVPPALPPDATLEAQVSNPVQDFFSLSELEAQPDPDSLPGVSIDELLDLQQQVEFFSVLGQEDAARKLLADHLRQTRGDYLLPYLQLRDVCRRHSDEAGFGQVRSRFQQRFGTTLPHWQDQAEEARHLEDRQDLMLDIERVWGDPKQAMETLDSLLRAGDRRDSLDSTVQSELLFLFTLARELRDHPVPASLPEPKASAAVPISGGLDIDLDLGIGRRPSSSAGPDLSLEFDFPAAVTPAEPAELPPSLADAEEAVQPFGVSEFSVRASRAEQSQSLPLIDFPFSGGDEEGLAPATFVAGSSQKKAATDQKPDEAWSSSTAAPTPDPKPGSQVLSLEFPDLDLPGVEEIAMAQTAAVDLELSFDTPDLSTLPPPLSVEEQRAASRFSLFSEEFDQVKRR